MKRTGEKVKISYQSAEGHTTLQDLSDAEVRTGFNVLTRQGYRAFAGTSLDVPAGPVRSFKDIPPGTEEIYFIAPLVGG